MDYDPALQKALSEVRVRAAWNRSILTEAIRGETLTFFDEAALQIAVENNDGLIKVIDSLLASNQGLSV